MHELLNAFLILLGILSAGIGLKGFLLPSSFIDGGVTGVSMLLGEDDEVAARRSGCRSSTCRSSSLGYRQLGRAFAVRSALAIAAPGGRACDDAFPDVTPDRLLTAVFGGFFIGAGIGLAVRGGAVLDGTEIAALLISKRSHC